MFLIIKGLIIVLILQGSDAGFFSAAENFLYAPKAVTSNVHSIAESGYSNVTRVMENTLNTTNNVVQDVGDLTHKVNLNSLLDKLDLNVNISAFGKEDLIGVFQKLNFANVNFTNYLSSVGFNVSDAIKSVKNGGSLIDYLNSISIEDSEDGRLDFVELVRKYVGTVNEYEVTTEDGYILKLYHIPGNVSKVVLMSPGLFSSSNDFIILGKISLVYTLACNKYDTWLLNYRGSRYSRKHVNLNPDTDKKFWDFSMQEWGHYDLAASIDFVLKKTQQKKLSLIGHSEGSAAALVLLSTRHQYNPKIKLFVALSPVCYLNHSGPVMTAIVRLVPVLNQLLVTLGIEELFGQHTLGKKLFRFICLQGLVGYDLCYRIVFGSISGYSPQNLRPDFFRTVVGHYPAGSSRKNLVHYYQIGNSGRFAEFDHGSRNIDIYGSTEPPTYDLHKVSCDVFVVVSENDKIFGLPDAERVRNELGNVVDYHIVEDKAFSHGDYVHSNTAYKVLYPRIIEKLNKYH